MWAVGARQDSFYQRPMAEHWNGTSWSVVSVPNPSYCTGHSYLTDITEVKATDLWAVGWCQSSSRGGEQGYVMRWNGSRWHYASVVTAGIPQNTEVYGVSAAGPSSVWMAGLSRDDGALTLRWDHTATHRITDGALQGNENLAGIVAPHGKPAFAVGAGGSPQPPFAGPAVVRLGRRAGRAGDRPGRLRPAVRRRLRPGPLGSGRWVRTSRGSTTRRWSCRGPCSYFGGVAERSVHPRR